MAQFVLDIPDSAAARIANAVCTSQGYWPTGVQDATEFTKQYVFRHLAGIVIGQEAAVAAAAASDEVRGNADDPLAAALFTPVAPAPAPEPGPIGPVDPNPGITGSTGFMSVTR